MSLVVPIAMREIPGVGATITAKAKRSVPTRLSSPYAAALVVQNTSGAVMIQSAMPATAHCDQVGARPNALAESRQTARPLMISLNPSQRLRASGGGKSHPAAGG